MICYQLRCPDAHQFEAWFRSGDAFDRQAADGLVECPACGSRAVARALMAPAVVGSPKRRRASEPASEAAGESARAPAPAVPAAEGEVIPPARAPALAGDIPAALRALLGRMREEVERTCDDVGAEFAETALRMHRGEEEKRGIYGQTTDVEREILAEEGVEVARIPWIKRAEG